MRKLYYRVFQKGMYVVLNFMPWREPKIINGDNPMESLVGVLKGKGLKKILVVTDEVLMGLKLLDGLFLELKKQELDFAVFDKAVPNPTIKNVEDGFAVYNSNNCDGIIAFGGGSPIDCAKIIGARAVRPKKSVIKMGGVLKVLKKLPPFVAIPTTSGTGSETTLAAMITDEENKRKIAFTDFPLIPHMAVLDPKLTLKLPPHITSATGMDALCHAVEAYVGGSNTKRTKTKAREAVVLIEKWLVKAYDDGSDIEARANMQVASYNAGCAFTRAFVGYVHALAHPLGAFYHTPHGLANAVIMPHVLKEYGSSVHKKLAELADLINLTNENDTAEQKANKFIAWIESMNIRMGIPTHFEFIEEKDMEQMAIFAAKEANPLYPVPKLFLKNDLITLYKKIKG